MKILERFFYHATAYTVAITMLFMGFTKIMAVHTMPYVTFGKFALIFAFGLVLSFSELIFTVQRIPKPLRYVIHYLVCVIAFTVVFMTIRSDDGALEFSAAKIFAAIIIFTAIYAIALPIVLIFKKTLTSNGEQKNYSKQEKNATKSKEKYTPRFTKK